MVRRPPRPTLDPSSAASDVYKRQTPEEARPVFAELRQLRDRLKRDFSGSNLADLSMGMTNDYEAAVEEGATIVRVGRAIFAPPPGA